MRILRRNKAFSILNILGLSIGIAASVLIFLVIRWETGYDGYQKNKDRVFRVVTSTVNKSNGELAEQHAYSPLGLEDVVRSEVTGLEKAAAFFVYPSWQIHIGAKGSPDGKVFLQKKVISAEPELFSMLDVQWLDGSAGSLTNTETAVISESLAAKWFGNWRNATGQMIGVNSGRNPMKIGGVFRDLPANTEVPLEMVMCYLDTKEGLYDAFRMRDRWHYPSRHSGLFVMTKEGVSSRQVEGQLAGIVAKYYNEGEAQYKTTSRLELQPLPAIHLDDRFDTLRGDALSRKVLWSLGIIGVFLLAVACINFINLSTVQSVKRSKEVGVRKVLGSDRGQLMRQFIMETALITFVAVVVGALLSQLALPWLQGVMGKPVSADWQRSFDLPLFLLAIGVLVIVLAGFYPAVVLSGFDAIAAIKNKISARTVGGLSLRRSLVVMQFVIAQLLIVGTIVVVRQMNYFRTRPMGFDQTAVAIVSVPGYQSYLSQQPYLKKKMMEIPGVEAAALTNEGPSGGRFWQQHSLYFDRSPVAQDWQTNVQVADSDFIRTMRIPLIAGTLPDSDRREVLVNETLLARLGLRSPAAIIGKSIAMDSSTNTFTVTGVVRDYNHQSLREAIGPVVIKPEAGGYNYLALRMRPSQLGATMPQVQATFSRVLPDILFSYEWLDERIAHFYEREATTSRLVRVFAGLAVLISCFGLYGLVAFLAVQKMKEIGIRKVLGASVGNIVVLFSREFTILTFVAFVISAPVGYLIMHRWLEGFYYHLDLDWTVFAGTLVLSLGIAWVTVAYKAMRAALVNPVKSLKSE